MAVKNLSSRRELVYRQYHAGLQPDSFGTAAGTHTLINANTGSSPPAIIRRAFFTGVNFQELRKIAIDLPHGIQQRAIAPRQRINRRANQAGI